MRDIMINTDVEQQLQQEFSVLTEDRQVSLRNRHWSSLSFVRVSKQTLVIFVFFCLHNSETDGNTVLTCYNVSSHSFCFQHCEMAVDNMGR